MKKKEKRRTKKLNEWSKAETMAKSKITWKRKVSIPLGKGNDSTQPRQNKLTTKVQPTKATKTITHPRAPLAHMHTPSLHCTQTGQAGFHHRSDRIPKIGQAGLSTSSPLITATGSRGAMQLFSAFLSPPCCQCMNQGSIWKECNPELLKLTKSTTSCYIWPNEQVRYSISSYEHKHHDHQVS
jgi:hypothetical protein